MSGVITFEHEADDSYLVAQFKCALQMNSSLSRLVRHQIRVASVIWALVFGLIFCLVLIGITGSVVRSIAAGGVYVFAHYATSHIPFFLKSQRRSYERHVLKRVVRMAKEHPSYLGRWKYTIGPESVEFENLTTGSVVVTKLRSIEQAELVDGHLCFLLEGEVTGSLPLEGLSSESDRGEIRRMLNEAGVQGWPRGESVLRA